MTELIWEKAWEMTKRNEGKYQCIYGDRGNWTSGKVGVGECKGTKYGICAMSYPNLDIKNLTLDQAKEIYRKDYWYQYKCEQLPDALSIALFDYVINSPGKQAVKDLQICLGVVADGVIGPQTIGAAHSKPTRDVLNEFMLRRLQFMVTKCNWNDFGKTWGERIFTVWSACEGMA